MGYLWLRNPYCTIEDDVAFTVHGAPPQRKILSRTHLDNQKSEREVLPFPEELEFMVSEMIGIHKDQNVVA
ncbi:hypothetical protein HYPP_03003 [Hyphomicrobium sp. ghe19]|nr:hypothetical protein HYPP_03003 [Hyphomicrobium sp. ghe19]